MKLFFQVEEKEVYISYTRAVLPADKKEYTLLFVYGLSKSEKFMLLTNLKINDKEDAIRLVRRYLDRWRIETYHRSIKTEYKYEDIRVRNLKSINNATYFLNIIITFIAKLVEEMDTNLLTHKIIDEAKALRKKVGIWITQFAQGIYNMLKRATKGIKLFYK